MILSSFNKKLKGVHFIPSSEDDGNKTHAFVLVFSIPLTNCAARAIQKNKKAKATTPLLLVTIISGENLFVNTKLGHHFGERCEAHGH
jgi:hypothetical protein